MAKEIDSKTTGTETVDQEQEKNRTMSMETSVDKEMGEIKNKKSDLLVERYDHSIHSEASIPVDEDFVESKNDDMETEAGECSILET